MCTVTYLPEDGGFQLTSNRDENIARKMALPPIVEYGHKQSLLYPLDGERKGSWIVAKSSGDVIVLLNGAFVKHNKSREYEKSRGLIVLQLARTESPLEAFKAMDLSGIEPFTVICCEKGGLMECRWDGTKQHVKYLDPAESYIWSSATLYDEQAAAKRKGWFENWRNSDSAHHPDNILRFHRLAGQGDLLNGLVIDRPDGIRTMSISHVRKTARDIVMTYHDLRLDSIHKATLQLPSEKNIKQRKLSAGMLFQRIRRFAIRCFNWEYWPFQLVYTPVMLYWFWLSLKARSLFFFNTSNPAIENGGFAMESKWDIYGIMPEGSFPKTLYFDPKCNLEEIKQKITGEGFQYPFIAKPDIGGRGLLVAKIHHEQELADYTAKMRAPFLLQKFVPYKNEVGIFYYRLPGSKSGHISGIVGKEFLSVTGDGKLTVTELMLKDARCLLQLSSLELSHSELLRTIPGQDEQQLLVPFGNHARGAKFIDLSHLITAELTQSIDLICQETKGFYFGRLDVMYDSWDDLSKGINFSVVELNGASSEPTHIYDPRHSLLFAWKEIIRHWRILYQISEANHREMGLPYLTYREGMKMIADNTAYLKLVS